MSARDDDDRPVGYGRPPAGRQFQKGQSGNPKGRPRKVSGLAANIDKALNEKVEIKEHGKRKRIPKAQAAAKQLANASANGDLRAIKLASDLSSKGAGSDAPADEAVSSVEQEIVARLIARVRQGWRQDDDAAL